MPRILITNGTIITSAHNGTVLNGHSLCLADDLIDSIGLSANYQAEDFDEVIDAQGLCVLPGFVNAHNHCYSAFACGLNKAEPAQNFSEVLEKLWWRLDKKLSLEDTYYSALIASIQAIRAGTTTFFDHHASPGAIHGSLDQIASATKLAGLRASLSYEVSDRDGAKIAQAGLAENARFLKRVKQDQDPCLQGLVGLHASFTLSNTTLHQAAQLAADCNTGVHIHVAEDLADQTQTLAQHGKRVIERLAQAGVLGPKGLFAHCVHLNPTEMDLLAEHGAVVTHQPQSNMNNAVGVMDLAALQQRQILVGLGTDAMTQNMLEEMRAALWLQKLTHKSPSGFFMESIDLLVHNNIQIAARHFPTPIGVLEPGSAADVILMDYRPPTPLTSDTLAGHFVFGLSQAQVDTTIVAGRVLMRQRRLLTLDEETIYAKSRELADKLWSRF